MLPKEQWLDLRTKKVGEGRRRHNFNSDSRLMRSCAIITRPGVSSVPRLCKRFSYEHQGQVGWYHSFSAAKKVRGTQRYE